MLARRKSGASAVSDYVSVPKDDIAEIKVKTKPKSDSLFLYFASFAASLTFFGGGTCLIWTSPVIPKLQSNDPDLNPLDHQITNFDISLLTGLFNMGSSVAPLFCGKLLDSFGRKNSLLLLGSCNGAAYIILAISKSILWMSVARTLNGIACGGLAVALPIFISEITEDHNRGKFGCIMTLFVPLGELYGYITGYFLSTKLFSFSCFVPILLHIILLLFLPETPSYLLYTNNGSKAAESLKKYKGDMDSLEIEKDILVMEQTLQQEQECRSGNLKSLFSEKTSRRALIIGLGILFTQAGTGIFLLLSFMGTIFEQAHSGISGNMTAILVGLLKVVIYFSVAQMVERLGRKPLMFFSSVLCSITLFFNGLYFFMKEHDVGSYHMYPWIPVAIILMYISFYSFGLGPLPTASLSELFPTNLRSTAVSFMILFTALYCTISASVFPFLLHAIGVSGCMWCFSACSALGAVFIYLLVPETKGRSVEEIQKILKGK